MTPEGTRAAGQLMIDSVDHPERVVEAEIPSTGRWVKVDIPTWNWAAARYRFQPGPPEYWQFTVDGNVHQYGSLEAARSQHVLYLEACRYPSKIVHVREVWDDSE